MKLLRGAPLFRVFCAALLCLGRPSNAASTKPQGASEPVLMVVMDPLSKELACACVKGYGQRDYRKLAARIEKALKHRVTIEFSDDLAESLAGVSPSRHVLVIGERSLVAPGAKKAGLRCSPVCELTAIDGSATMTASVIARADDPARDLKDAAGRKVFIGLAEADDLYAAALKTLRGIGIDSAAIERRAAYSEAALDMLDSKLSPAPLAVIPSYALPLLEGCGSIKPGSMKVLGKTEPAQFITVFISENMPSEQQAKVVQSLLAVKTDAKFLKLMESRDGFRPLDSKTTNSARPTAALDWPDWRGPNRDGRVPHLPARLPAKPNFLWKRPAMNGGLAGLSVADGKLMVAERDFADAHDVYRCLDANTGELLWLVQFPATGKLDYGEFPRATPVLHQGKAYVLGAFGGLRCVNLVNGKVIWERQLAREFKAKLPTWGMCSTPVLVNDLLIVNPGAPQASLVALDSATGQTRWTSPGLPPSYGNFIFGEFGNRRQLVGYDQRSLGGWDVTTGKRLWQMVPPAEGDFNVPTPVAAEEGVVVSTENNGTRSYSFDKSGCIVKQPTARFADLSPNTATPVVTCQRLFGAYQGLYCLDLRQGLKPIWHYEEKDLGDHASFIADDARVLVMTFAGELILLDARADECSILSRFKLFDDDVELYSHPALAGSLLYARGGSSVVCVDLGQN